MRKVILSISISLDGFIDHTAMIADEETHQYAADVLNSVDTVLFGRVTYQLFADYWPSAALDTSLTKGILEYAHKINSIPKIVFSKTLEKVDWNNARLVKGDAVEEVARWRQQPGRGMAIAGSVLANTLMQHHLIDEYQLLINPTILGSGRRLFRESIPKTALQLVETKTFRSGIVLVRYLSDRK